MLNRSYQMKRFQVCWARGGACCSMFRLCVWICVLVVICRQCMYRWVCIYIHLCRSVCTVYASMCVLCVSIYVCACVQNPTCTSVVSEEVALEEYLSTMKR